jgi:hypothetical protein
MDQWYELVHIASSIQFSKNDDAIIWKFSSKGRYTVQSLYAVVSDRGLDRYILQLCGRLMCLLNCMFFFGC